MLKKGEEQRFALRQEQCGCSRFHSFPCSFWSLCFSISAAAASFVQDSYIDRNLHIQYEFPEEFTTFIVWQILLIQPGVSNDNRNDNETITKNSKIAVGQTLAHRSLKNSFSWRTLLVLMRSKQALDSLDMAGPRCFLNELLKTDRGGCERRFLARVPSKTEWKM